MRYMKTGEGLPNKGLEALAKKRPDVVRDMGYDVAMDGTKLADISKKLGIKPETARQLATIGMKAMKNGGVVGGAPVLSAEDGARMYLFGGGLKQKFQDFAERRPGLTKGLGMGVGFLAGGPGGAALAGYAIDKNRDRKAALAAEEAINTATEIDPLTPAEPMQPVDTAVAPVEPMQPVGEGMYQDGGMYQYNKELDSMGYGGKMYGYGGVRPLKSYGYGGYMK